MLGVQLAQLESEEAALASELDGLGSSIVVLMKKNQSQMHVTQTDVRSIFNNDNTVISIKTPENAVCEISIPDHRKGATPHKHQVFLQSPDGAMQVTGSYTGSYTGSWCT